jgi:hypothetical protein
MGQRATKTILKNEKGVETPKMTYSFMENSFYKGIAFQNNFYLVEIIESVKFYILDEKNMTVKLLKEFDGVYVSETFEQEGKLYICFMTVGDTKNPSCTPSSMVKLSLKWKKRK